MAPVENLSFELDNTSPTLQAKKEYRQQRKQQKKLPPGPAYPVTAPAPAWPRQAPAQAFGVKGHEQDEEEEEEGQVLSPSSELLIWRPADVDPLFLVHSSSDILRLHLTLLYSALDRTSCTLEELYYSHYAGS
jgi:hypothetical protein